MKRMHKSNPSDINGLPEDLVENILIYLPIQDAVKTSILSRKWRYAWTKLYQLVFDDNFCAESILKTKSNLIKAINRVIFLHDGPLKSFSLTVSNLESSCPDIDQFLLVVLKKGIDGLELRFQNDEPYKLPSSVFAYGQQLEHLQLQSCVFKPPSGFSGFSKLETLEVDEVGISGSRFSRIISHCPVLKSLSFRCFTRCSPIDITAPNLEFLSIQGPCQPLCLKNTPKLATVSIYSGYVVDDILKDILASSRSILCGRLPVVKELALDNRYLEYMASDKASALLVKDLRHLKILCLLYICFGFINGVSDVSSALCLIENCPALEELNILVHTDDTASEVEFSEAEGVSLDHLKKVELQQVSGLKCELQFIKFILANSPVLEKLLIMPDSNLVGDKGLKFFKELARFRRASPLVEIAYEC